MLQPTPTHLPKPVSGASTPETARFWLKRFERLLRGDVDHLCTLVSREMGKSEWEVFSSELMPLMASIRWHRRHLKRLLRTRRLRGGAFWQLSQRQRLYREPLGTVGIIATWNYPIQLLGVQLVQALTAGNRVVVKPSEHAPESQLRLLELAREAGLPEGTLRWTEATREAGAALLQEEALDHLIFTGSTEVGRIVAKACAERLISSTLELSGRDSAIVLDDADPKRAADSIWNALVMNAGQTCMAPRRVLVEAPMYRRFIEALEPIVSASTAVRLVQPQEVERCLGLVRDAVTAGGRCLGGPVESTDGRTMQPLAVVDCPPEARLVEGAHFGPVLAVIPCSDFSEVLERHARCDQKLATAVFTQSEGRLERIAEDFESGIVTLNDCVLPSGHPAAPISGRGASGWGSSHGAEGLLQLTRPVVVSRTGRFMRLPTEVPSDGIQQFLRRIMRRGAHRG
ncbi:MAG: aldehyde dehydrogenase family protein [Phycisphaerales bacterium]|nr:aldehyde dehydrogenase family protein [Phycisphaerales bacterium]